MRAARSRSRHGAAVNDVGSVIKTGDPLAPIKDRIEAVKAVVEAVANPAQTVENIAEAVNSPDPEVRQQAKGGIIAGVITAAAGGFAGAKGILGKIPKPKTPVAARPKVCPAPAAPATPKTTASPITPKSTTSSAASGGKTIVYRSINPVTGEVQYIGITNHFARRAMQHMKAMGIQIYPLVSGLTRSAARAVEQALINIHGMGKSGGTLLNKINSIAKTNPTYAQQLLRGYRILQKIGYPIK